ncbi:tetratricopeptide repeat protein [Arenimonas sp.]|nr:tetratricopeptide repeat protein [Candidatus Parcubacteria bacterium]
MKINKIIHSKLLPLIIVFLLIFLGFIFVFIVPAINENRSIDKNLTPLDKTIETKKSIIKSNPKITKNYFELSAAYLQKVRETGNSSYYTDIDTLMQKAAEVEPENAEIYATKASVAIGRHNFLEGKKMIEIAISKNPNRDTYYGLLGDAHIELGEYDAAILSFQKMVDMRPGFNSYSRIAYIRELYGDVKGAKEALQLAITSGSNYKDDISWAYVELGKLSLRNNLDEAEVLFKKALNISPFYSQAYEGLAKVEFLKGNTKVAIEHLNTAIKQLPLTQYSNNLADIYNSINDTVKRDQYLAITQASYSQASKAGVNTDLEESLFLSNNDINLKESLIKATRAYKDRPTIFAADTLAWAYYKNQNYSEAGKYTKESLRLGNFDTTILFHQGMIALKNKDTILAKKYLKEAYKINPNFSIKDTSILKKLVVQFK